VTVTNGILKIDFVTVVDNAKVSAILVQNRWTRIRFSNMGLEKALQGGFK
jgi:hypothetical protein